MGWMVPCISEMPPRSVCAYCSESMTSFIANVRRISKNSHDNLGILIQQIIQRFHANTVDMGALGRLLYMCHFNTVTVPK